MAQVTDETRLQGERYLANQQSVERNVNDEDLIQEVADFIFLTSENVSNPNLAASFRDMANLLVQNKANMARGGSEATQPPPPSPEERLAAQGMGAGAPPPQGQF